MVRSGRSVVDQRIPSVGQEARGRSCIPVDPLRSVGIPLGLDREGRIFEPKGTEGTDELTVADGADLSLPTLVLTSSLRATARGALKRQDCSRPRTEGDRTVSASSTDRGRTGTLVDSRIRSEVSIGAVASNFYDKKIDSEILASPRTRVGLGISVSATGGPIPILGTGQEPRTKDEGRMT